MLSLKNKHRQKATENQGWYLMTLRVQREKDKPTNNIENIEFKRTT